MLLPSRLLLIKYLIIHIREADSDESENKVESFIISFLICSDIGPSFVLLPILQVTTTIGYGSPNKANSYSVHGSALGAKEVDATRKNLGWPHEPFHVPEDVKKY